MSAGRVQRPPAQPDARCACCGDAYGTRWLCRACRADPANASWVEAQEVEVGVDRVFDDAVPVDLSGDVPVWNPTPRQRAILQLLVQGGTPRGVAAATGSSEQYVRRVLNEFKLQGKSE